MYDLHEALEKCDIGVDREALLLDSLLFGDSQFHTSLDLPGKKLQQDQFRDEMAKLLRDWRAERWSAVGAQMGDILRGAVLDAFPQKYAVDESGRLRRQVLGASELGPSLTRHSSST